MAVEQLEREPDFSRDILLKTFRPETKHFFQQLFFPSVEREAFGQIQSRLKETENVLNETLEKRNQLETERIQLLDQIAELRVSLARVHSQERFTRNYFVFENFLIICTKKYENFGISSSIHISKPTTIFTQLRTYKPFL